MSAIYSQNLSNFSDTNGTEESVQIKRCPDFRINMDTNTYLLSVLI